MLACVPMDEFTKGSFQPYLDHCAIAVKRHHDHGSSCERKHLIGARFRGVRGLVHYHHDREHDITQTDTVLEKGLRVVHPDLHSPGRKSAAGPGLCFLCPHDILLQ